MDTKFKKGMTPWNKPATQFTAICKVCHITFNIRRYMMDRKYCTRICAHKGQGRTRTGNKYRLGTTQSIETRKKMSDARIGELNVNWIFDRTLLKKQEERNGNRHKEWSRSVKNRDSWKCKISNGSCSGQVVAHHILPWRDCVDLR